MGPVIKVKYSGSRLFASHKRDGVRTWKAWVKYDHALTKDDNRLAAAQRLVETWPLSAEGSLTEIGYDADYTYFVFNLKAYS